MSTCVVYKPSRCFPPQAATAEVWFDNLALKPGAGNFLSEDQLAILTSHPDYSRYQNWEAIEVITPNNSTAQEASPRLGNYPASLAGISVAKAEDIVNACDDLVALRAWFDAETRKALREILTRRIEEITI